MMKELEDVTSIISKSHSLVQKALPNVKRSMTKQNEKLRRVENAKENKQDIASTSSKQENKHNNNLKLGTAAAMCSLANVGTKTEVISDSMDVTPDQNTPRPKNKDQCSPIKVREIANAEDRKNSSNKFIKYMKENLNLIPMKFKRLQKLAKMQKESAPKDWNQKSRK